MSWLIDGLWNRNTNPRSAKNLNCALIGESGMGKSYAALKICELYYNEKLNQDFPVDNIVFTISDFLERIRAVEKKSCIIFDDAGLKYSSARWYDELNQILGYTLQSYRYRIVNLFFTIPVMNWLDRIGRGMLHSQIEMKAVGVGSYVRLNYNPYKNKVYYKRLRLLDIKLPSEKLTTMYEEKKDMFLQHEYTSYLNKAKSREAEEMSNNDLINMIVSDPTRFKMNGIFNDVILKNELEISRARSKELIVLLKYKGILPGKDAGKLYCSKCGHSWYIRKGKPSVQCPSCRTRAYTQDNKG